MKQLLDNYLYEISVEGNNVYVFRKKKNSLERYQTKDSVIIDQTWLVIPRLQLITRYPKEQAYEKYFNNRRRHR